MEKAPVVTAYGVVAICVMMGLILSMLVSGMTINLGQSTGNNSPKSTVPSLPPECKLDMANIAKNATDIPPPISPTRTSPANVTVHLRTEELCAEIDSGQSYQYWTFNGTVPGPLIRVLVGDNVTIVLTNNDPGMVHSIDLHAVTGPGGGMMLSQTNPGATTSFWFKALYPGLYVYHCATPPADWHIANGMYGMILVEPQGGLPHVDKEFYVMQGEFYTNGLKGMTGHHVFNSTEMLTGIPDYVVFNGRVGALTGSGALHAQVGQTIRIFFGVGGPNLDSSFHIIGQVMNKIYPEGAISESTTLANVQTTLVPPGGATVIQQTLLVNGSFSLVDHSLTWAIEKGAAGALVVSGTSTPGIFSSS
ncbi:MAG TPA: copper-containing nitrite reductase [Candidatus Dormibacteraeota bacterium]|jgi:nitrite reductase (NO-forming)|nr:copper-containing nitrite reductase [Candidatus Dormibacteraeota bacterium]